MVTLTTPNHAHELPNDSRFLKSGVPLPAGGVARMRPLQKTADCMMSCKAKALKFQSTLEHKIHTVLFASKCL